MAVNILMPALSPTMEEGALAKWHVKEGDEIASGDVIAEVETDKATLEVEAVDEGRIGKILVAEGTDGIKVNSICPGNFLDGPLWSDPDRGLFVQYLNTGKVPGAKTIADVRAFYEAKVPMKRGCTTEDVMKAVRYVVDQRYETGQAIPVTGGQLMLN